MSTYTSVQKEKIPAALSETRFSRYLAHCEGDVTKGLDLYRWNVEISGECLKVLHICEITFRNAVSAALEAQYGVNWPSVRAFQVSLPNPSRGWSARNDIEVLARKYRHDSQVGKLIADSKFAFWCKLMNASQNDRIWNKHFRIAFPNAPLRLSTNEERQEIMDAISEVRELRNRIAHHEPIFTRDMLAAEVESAFFIIGCRCKITEEWCRSHDKIFDLLAKRP
ncbi:hypothetical protein [Celeribacter sp.]|uniref:hypothetical protein n=1 Tax=Celeribacter sp. TaxID=1890673 RepID=UPI003A9556AE